MRRSSKAVRRGNGTQRQRTDSGTIKSIERQRGTGSIAPDIGSQVNADTGFTSDDVVQGDFTTLQVGNRVRFESAHDPDRPGYADATAIKPVEPTEPKDEAIAGCDDDVSVNVTPT